MDCLSRVAEWRDAAVCRLLHDGYKLAEVSDIKYVHVREHTYHNGVAAFMRIGLRAENSQATEGSALQIWLK